MRDVVLDASVVAKWFRRTNERRVAEAVGLRTAYGNGELGVIAPSLLPLELIDVAGRKWHWARAQLEALAHEIEELGFEFMEPDLRSVARLTAAGLTAYDAAYVAIAEDHGLQLVTDDERLAAVVPHVAVALADR
jgi:predicted nucleic acid-binding protein